jgi:hypothetical protein
MNKPGSEHKLLDMFEGKWKTEGTVKARGDDPELKITGTDVYEWFEGGFFLIHKVDVVIGKEKIKNIEIIGYDELTNSYTLHSFDNKGNSEEMKGSFNKGVWTISGNSLRFNGRFTEDGKILSGIWERQDDGKNWLHLMDIKLTKQA